MNKIYYTSTKSWRGYIFTAVCLCVCLCVRLCLLTKFQTNGCIDLDAVFAKRLLSTLARTLLKLVTKVSKVKVTVDQNPFSLHNALLTSLLCILALVCLIKLRFGKPLRYDLCRFDMEFHKN